METLTTRRRRLQKAGHYLYQKSAHFSNQSPLPPSVDNNGQNLLRFKIVSNFSALDIQVKSDGWIGSTANKS